MWCALMGRTVILVKNERDSDCAIRRYLSGYLRKLSVRKANWKRFRKVAERMRNERWNMVLLTEL